MYRAYWRVTSADNGRGLGPVGLTPVIATLNAHLSEEASDLTVWPPYVTFATHLGKPVIRMDVGSAWEARLVVSTVERFLRATGWRWTVRTNSATRRAL